LRCGLQIQSPISSLGVKVNPFTVTNKGSATQTKHQAEVRSWPYHSGFRIHLTLWTTLLLLAILPSIASQATQQEAFDQANLAFEQQDYAGAISQYQHILEQATPTASVHFNLGNAYFRQGRTGMATYHLLMARTLDPGDPDILANLKFVRESAGLPTSGLVSGRARWMQRLTLNQWSVLLGLPLWLWASLQAASILGQGHHAYFQSGKKIFGWLAIPSAALLIFLGLSARQNQLGVIVVPEVALHASPFADSKELGTLEGGQEILLRENKGSWRRVVIADGTSGWLASDQFRSIPTR
jgi:tetratricopeptide (TPR) repeat protein